MLSDFVASFAVTGRMVAKSTVERYKPHGERLPSATWRTFLDLHLKDLVAIDFFVVPTATFKVFFVFVVLNQQHLKRLLSSYLDYYHPWRTHRSLDQDAPDGRPVRLAELGQIAELPVIQGLHHYYLPRAA